MSALPVSGEGLNPSAIASPPTASPPPPPPPPAVEPPWEAHARAWLATLPAARRLPSAAEMDVWIDCATADAALPQSVQFLPRPHLHQRLLALVPAPTPAVETSPIEHPYRFQRTSLWAPAYSWLESLDANEIVRPEQIADWLEANPEVKESLFAKHPRYHLMHYVQKLHMKMLKKNGKMPKDMDLSTVKASVKALNGGTVEREGPIQPRFSDDILDDSKPMICKKKEAFLRYEILTDLQNQLASFLAEHRRAVNSPLPKQISDNKISSCSFDAIKKDENNDIANPDSSLSHDVVSVHGQQIKRKPPVEAITGHKRTKLPSTLIPATVIPAWSHSETMIVTGVCEGDQPSSSICKEASADYVENGDAHPFSIRRSPLRKNIVMCLHGREKGNSWPVACSRSGYAGRNQERFIPFLEGWRSLESQFEGPAVLLNRRSYSSWSPNWCAYTSNFAQPYGRQGVQKVLDVRFHPEGLPQLVCSSNEAPNELLLYNLLSGRATQLTGHNCQIQAVDFAVRGASIVSCGSNLLKVWDCITGSCLFTLGGSSGEDQTSIGHTKRIGAMTVNAWQSCLVVTSGTRGDGKLLLWNALRGELVTDLSSSSRMIDQVYPCIGAMEFCNENLLASGSDCDYGSPAVVQLWDIESSLSSQSFPASNSSISALKVDPASNTIITGARDGTVVLFDARTCDAINYLSVGSANEVTSVSFSSCGTYFNASSTSNNTLVWDRRLMPMNLGQMPIQNSHWSSDTRLMKPLHCLSHGKQMPTAEHTGQLPGHVEVGDQGVNASRWLQREPVLVTASGNGSIAMWDVTLGRPCVRHLISHTRCANTVAVSSNDEYLCSGGDDQKVVLYHSGRGRSHSHWRLSHPLTEIE